MEPTQLEGVQKQLRERLNALDTVQEVATHPEEMRVTGAEVIAAISTTIVIVQNTQNLVEQTRKLFASINRLIREIRGLRRVLVDCEDERIPIAPLTDEQCEQVVQP
jgi:hypothetical protein